MKINCKFKNFGFDYEIFGAVAIYRYCKFGSCRRQIYNLKKSHDLSEFDFNLKGESFEHLENLCLSLCINYAVFFEREQIIGDVITDLENTLVISTQSRDKCKNLMVLTRLEDACYIPKGLKINGKFVDRLDKIVGGLINPCPLNLHAEDPSNFIFTISEWEKKLNSHFYVYEKKRQNSRNQSWNRIYGGNNNYPNAYKFHFFAPFSKLVQIVDEKQYFSGQYKCPNISFKCHYEANNMASFLRHVKCCKDPQILRDNPVVKQVEYGKYFHPINNLISSGLLDCEPDIRDFIFFDIETIVKRTYSCSKSTEVISTHHLLSIAANAFINGTHVQDCWVIKESTFEAELEIVRKFLDFIYKLG